MFSFFFSYGRHLVISAEIRKEYSETFDAIKGVMNQFENQYVIATESDAIQLRTMRGVFPVNSKVVYSTESLILLNTA